MSEEEKFATHSNDLALEPVARGFVQSLSAETAQSLEEMGVFTAREYMRRSQPTVFGKPGLCVEERTIAGVRNIVVRPAERSEHLPVVLYLHGGGWTLGAPETHVRLIQTIAAETRCAVVAPDYALAPEHPYPAALDQCYAIAQEIYSGTAGADLDGTRLAVAGDSAGANLAAALAVMAVERSGPRFALQALICPALRVQPISQSYRDFGSGMNLAAEDMQWFWKQYVPSDSQWSDPHVAPLLASIDVLSRVAPAWIAAAGCDVLRDEAEEFGMRLLKAGNYATMLRCFGTIHNFPVIDDLQTSGPAIAATAALCAALRFALHPEKR
jgi:acetyl esterase